MPYTKLERKRGCTAVCDHCGYAMGSGITNSLNWVRALRADGWTTWRRRGQTKRAWCPASPCQADALDFLAKDKREQADITNAERRLKRKRERERALADSEVIAPEMAASYGGAVKDPLAS